MFDVEQLALLMRCALVTMRNEQFWCPVVDFQRNIFPTLWTSSMVHGMYQVWNVKCSVFVKCYIFLFFVWKWYFYDKTLLSVKCDTHFVTVKEMHVCGKYCCCCSRESLLKFASESQPRLPSLEAFKWRVDVGISTRYATAGYAPVI